MKSGSSPAPEHQEARPLATPEKGLGLDNPEQHLERLVERVVARRFDRLDRALGELRQVLARIDSRHRHLD